jgi:hypothetical protein
MPSEFLKNHKCCEVDINFRAEGNIGDKLIVKTVSGKEQCVFNHSIAGSSGEKDLVRMKSVWVK